MAPVLLARGWRLLFMIRGWDKWVDDRSLCLRWAFDSARFILASFLQDNPNVVHEITHQKGFVKSQRLDLAQESVDFWISSMAGIMVRISPM